MFLGVFDSYLDQTLGLDPDCSLLAVFQYVRFHIHKPEVSSEGCRMHELGHREHFSCGETHRNLLAM